VVLGFPVGGYQAEFARGLAGHVTAGGGPKDIDVELVSKVTAHAVQRQLSPLAGVKNIVAVASGKGGVGKSTVAANLALAWAHQGAKVGVLDADIYGPSQPIMLGLTGQRPASPDGKRIKPLQAHGIAAMSIGFLIDPEQPMVWRGPMVTRRCHSCSRHRMGRARLPGHDMPPGTGDIQLTLAQRARGGCRHRDYAAGHRPCRCAQGSQDVEKVNAGARIVENMSVRVYQLRSRRHLLAAAAARMAARRRRAARELPLDVRREEADGGAPTVVAASIQRTRRRTSSWRGARLRRSLRAARKIVRPCFQKLWWKKEDEYQVRPLDSPHGGESR
jgi:ATP-binding protein involved in chromosome partitioning